MKVLWIVNTIFPEPAKVIGMPEPVFGGWMYGLCEKISSFEEIELGVATTYLNKVFFDTKINGIEYFLLPTVNQIKYDKELENYWEKVFNIFKPDIIHIHGTEYPHGLACINKFSDFKYVISIQGLVSVYSRYFYAGISNIDLLRNITFHDLIRFDSLFHRKNQLIKRGRIEKEYLKKSKHVIGRTDWDFSQVMAINNEVNYHFCNESLRNKFYKASKWIIDNQNRQIIFLSQSSTPIKGLHQVIKALVFLKNEFPLLKIRVGGNDITKNKLIKDKIRITGYGKYLNRLIKKYNLENHIIFLDTLSEEQMIMEYQNASIFICPSSIENSPNSLGEAQLIGVPVIASFVGGISNMVIDGETGLLYRFEEAEMLTEKIRQVLKDKDLALKLSKNGIIAAKLRHDRIKNSERTKEIYMKIINQY